MKKVLICTGEEKLFDNEMTMFKNNNSNFQIKHVKMFLFENKLHKILRNLGGLFIKFELSDIWKKDLSNYHTIIIFESVVKNAAIKYIRKQNPNIRIIIYFRNKLSYSKKRNISIKYLEKLNCEFWSYNIEDCDKIGFKYNNQFWNTEYLKELPQDVEEKYTFLFLGKIKNREEKLIELHNLCEKQSLNDYFYLVPKSEYSFDKNNYDKYMDYLEYLEKANKTKVIVDLVSNSNYGLTLRPLEACFLNKKLITNYKDIIKYDFYNPNNIFILDFDDINNIIEFLNKPYKNIDEKIMKKYTYDAWINNFFKGDI